MKQLLLFITSVLAAPFSLYSLTTEELDIYEEIIRFYFNESNSGDSVYGVIGFKEQQMLLPDDLKSAVSDLGLVWISSDDGEHLLQMSEIITQEVDRRTVLGKKNINALSIVLIKENGLWRVEATVPFFP